MSTLSYHLRNISNRVADYLENCERRTELATMLDKYQETGNTNSFTPSEISDFFMRKHVYLLKDPSQKDKKNRDVKSERAGKQWIILLREAFYSDSNSPTIK